MIKRLTYTALLGLSLISGCSNEQKQNLEPAKTTENHSQSFQQKSNFGVTFQQVEKQIRDNCVLNDLNPVVWVKKNDADGQKEAQLSYKSRPYTYSIFTDQNDVVTKATINLNPAKISDDLEKTFREYMGAGFFLIEFHKNKKLDIEQYTASATEMVNNMNNGQTKGSFQFEGINVNYFTDEKTSMVIVLTP